MKKLIIFFSLLSISIYSFSLLLVNDSPFELTAIVQAANGQFLGQEHLQPGEQRHWSTDQSRTDLKDIYDNSYSLTPLTVIWKCAYQGYYSVCADISPGSTVQAHDCPGSKSCTTKKEAEENQPKCPPCPTCPPCPKCPSK